MKRGLCVYDQIVMLLMYWLVFQDVALPLFYKYTGNVLATNVLFYAKDMMMIGLFVAALFTKRIDCRLLTCTVLFLAGFFVSFVKTILFRDVPLMTALQSARGMLLLPVFLCIGNAISNKSEFRQAVLKKYFILLLISGCLGIVDYVADAVVGTREFWKTGIGLTRFHEDIKKTGSQMWFGLPGNFYGTYGGEFFSAKRLVGLWAGPLTAAYSLLLPLSYYYFRIHGTVLGRMKKYLVWEMFFLLLVMISIYLTHTRAILLLGLAVIGLYSLIHYHENMRITVVGIIGVIAVLFMLDYEALWRFMYDGSTMGHISSIFDAIANIKWSVFGEGFAYIGIYGEVGAENTYLSVLGNMGIWGVILYVYLFIRALVLCKHKAKNGDALDRAVLYSGLALLLSGIISEQLVAFTTIAPSYILIGLTSSK